MLRILAVLLALTAPAAAQTSAKVTGAPGPASPLLKRSVTVTSEVVRIGDLIDNAGAAAQIAIFRAPDLGTAGTVSTAQILQAARAHAVVGIDTAGISEVLVTRASRAITGKDVEARIAEAIAFQLGLSGDSEVIARLDREMRTLHVEANATGPLQIARLTFDPRSGHFDAALEIPGSTVARRVPLRFSGKAMETVEIAALARPLARGDVVRASDIVVERRPKSEAGADLAGDAGRVAGMALRRAMRAGQILRTADLMRPELVQRNENVTLIFEAPGIMLTSRAKALESGAEGDLISVLNVQSKRTVQGTVTGPNTVTVTSMKPRIAAVASADTASLQNPRTE
ncbi:MAG TPA: flagellar basal body P-ring formation chaperone FlgA [Xanthobacteraceae bacterium]|nr:flagellar basal body P-ring formation chaperone FlgA [Xanthobacteraceae bacterium]